jgi:O-antigen/teichoic acid export membrane protein
MRNDVQTRPRELSSLTGNFAWTLLGNALHGACQWAMLIVLSKVGSPEILGKFVLGLTVCTPLMMLAHLELRAVESTDASHEYTFGNYLAAVLIASVGSLPIIGSIVGIAGYGLELASVILLMWLFKLFENTSFVFYGLFQQREKMKFFCVSLFLKGALSLLFIGLSIYIYRSLVLGVFLLSMTWGTILVTYDALSGRKVLNEIGLRGRTRGRTDQGGGNSIRPNWDSAALKSIFVICLPLGLASAIASLDVNIPRYLMERHLSLNALGIFSAIAYISVVGGRFVVTLMYAFMPRLARYYLDDEKAAFVSLLYRQGLAIVLVGLVGILVAVLWGSEFLTFTYSAEYAKYNDVFVLLMVSASVQYLNVLLRNILIVARLTRVDFVLRIVSVLVLTLGCFALIPAHGLTGGAMGSIGGSVVYLIGGSVIGFRIIGGFLRGSRTCC